MGWPVRLIVLLVTAVLGLFGGWFVGFVFGLLVDLGLNAFGADVGGFAFYFGYGGAFLGLAVAIVWAGTWAAARSRW